MQSIKKLNIGIQVIIFSATTKVWNLQALQEVGADGFIVKESPENSLDTFFTVKTLSEFVKTMDKSIERLFLKTVFMDLNKIKYHLNLIDHVPENRGFNTFIKELRKQFEVIYAGVENIKLGRSITLDAVFLSCYTFLDLFKKYYLFKGQDYRYYLGFRKEELIRYSVIGNIVQAGGAFIPIEHYEKPGIFHIYSGLLMDYFKNLSIYDLNTFISNFHKIRDFRNDYIHGSKQKFSKEEVMLIVKSLMPITHSICE